MAASLVAFAQAQSSSGSTSSAGNSASGRSSESATGSSRSADTPSSMRTPSTSEPASSDQSRSVTTARTSGSGSSDVSSLRRVTQDSLDRQLTAKALIGKNVHDASGEKIGEVRDIVLDASGAPQLASGIASRAQERARRDNAAALPNSGTSDAATGIGSPRVTPSGDYAAGPAGDGPTADHARRGANEDAVSSDLSGQAREIGSVVSNRLAAGGPAAVISSGGVMGLGANLIRVPLSQLRYDAERDRVTLDVSREQISSIMDSDAAEASRSTAE